MEGGKFSCSVPVILHTNPNPNEEDPIALADNDQEATNDEMIQSIEERLKALFNENVTVSTADQVEIEEVVFYENVTVSTIDFKELTSKLMDAIRENDIEAIEALLDGLSSNERLRVLAMQATDGHTPLTLAACIDKVTVIEVLLEGLSPDEQREAIATQGAAGNTPMTMAVYMGRVEVIALLNSRSPRAFEAKNAEGRTALALAIQIGREEIIEELLRDLPPDEQQEALIAHGADRYTVLTHLVRIGQTEAIKAFFKDLSSDERLKLITRKNGEGRTALTLAVYHCQAEIIEVLFNGLSSTQRLIALATQDNDGHTALTIATHYGPAKTIGTSIQIEIIKALLRGLSPEERLTALAIQDKDEFNALTLAARTDEREAIKALLDGLSPDERLRAITEQDKSGRTALMRAGYYGLAESIEALFDGLSLDKKQLALTHRGGGEWSNFTTLDMCLAHHNCNEKTLALLTSLHAPYSTDDSSDKSTMVSLLHLKFGLPMPPGMGSVPPSVSFHSLGSSLVRSNQETNSEHNVLLKKIESDFLKTNTCQLEPANIVAARILRGETVVIPTGWNGHSTAIVFVNGLILKCNRGYRLKGTDAGMSVFSSSKLTLDTLTLAIEMLRDGNQSNFYEELDATLDLRSVPLNDQEVAFVHRKDQKSGNCTYASPKTALAAILFAEFRNIPGGLAFAAEYYKKLTTLDRSIGLEKGASLSAEYPEATDKARLALDSRHSRLLTDVPHSSPPASHP